MQRRAAHWRPCSYQQEVHQNQLCCQSNISNNTHLVFNQGKYKTWKQELHKNLTAITNVGMMICRSLTGDAASDNPFAVDAQQRSSRGKVSIVLVKTLFFFQPLFEPESTLSSWFSRLSNPLSTSFIYSNINSTIDPWHSTLQLVAFVLQERITST